MNALSGTPARRTGAGFTMVEVIMCLAVIGIMVAMVMAVFSSLDGVEQAKDQRNAQGFCSLYTSAEAAGVHLFEEGISKMEILRALKSGVTAQAGPFRGKIFALPGVDDRDLEAAARFVELRNGNLVYQSMGVP
jgi:prepilin-type N-terminal cleavage/methylation domain-containing protein